MQEIIVYRNPLEAALWSAIMDGSFLAALVGVAAFFCVFLAVNRVLNKGRSWGKNVKRNTNIALGVGVLSAVAVIFFMI